MPVESWQVGPFVKALERAVADVDVAVRDVVAHAKTDLEAAAKKGFPAAHKRGTPTPAAPGQPPAVVTGTLRRSITSQGPTRVGFGTYSATVGPTVVYARVQELGGKTGLGHRTTLPARPYLAPAFERWKSDNRFRDELARAVFTAFR